MNFPETIIVEVDCISYNKPTQLQYELPARVVPFGNSTFFYINLTPRQLNKKHICDCNSCRIFYNETGFQCTAITRVRTPELHSRLTGEIPGGNHYDNNQQ